MPLAVLLLLGAPTRTDENSAQDLAAAHRRLHSQRDDLGRQRDRLAVEARAAETPEPYLILDLPARTVALRLAGVPLRQAEIRASTGPQRRLAIGARRVTDRRYQVADPASADTASADTAAADSTAADSAASDSTVRGAPGGDPTPGDTALVDSGGAAAPGAKARLEVMLEGGVVLRVQSDAGQRSALSALLEYLADRARCLAGRGGCDDLRVVVAPEAYRWLDVAAQPGRTVLLFCD